MSFVAGDIQTVFPRLAELTEELLDAHCDTVCLAHGVQATPTWLAHIDYLKDLQRVGQRTLAELARPGDDQPRPVRISAQRLRRGPSQFLARLHLPVGQLRRQ